MDDFADTGSHPAAPTTSYKFWWQPTTILFAGLILLIPLATFTFQNYRTFQTGQDWIPATTDMVRSPSLPPLDDFQTSPHKLIQFYPGLADTCISKVCLWNTEYLSQVGKSRVKPCDDFYEHVCAAIKSNIEDSMHLSFARMSTQQLIKDFDLFFERFFQLKRERSQEREANFLTQSMLVYTKCKGNHSSSDAEALNAFRRILAAIHISDWPYAKFAGDIVEVVSAADRELMLRPMFRVHVLRDIRKNGTPHIVLKAPLTHLNRQVISPDVNYTKYYEQSLARVLNTYRNSSDANKAARQIYWLQMALKKLSYVDSSHRDLDVRTMTSIGALRNCDSWHWLRYFKRLFNTSDSIVPSTHVFLEDPAFFRKFTSIFDLEDSGTTVANYVGLKVLLTLWPFMPTAFHFAYKLTQDPNMVPLDARISACSATVEKMYRYGVGIAVKLAASGEFADVYRRDRDEQFAALFRDARMVLKELLETGRSWFGLADVQRAVNTLNSMTFAFGTQHNFQQYEDYRNTPDLSLRSTASGLDAVLSVFSHASSLYWNAHATSADYARAYDNTYITSVFDWDSEYQPTNNHVFIPNAVVGFLRDTSNKIPLPLYPIISQHVVKAMLQALLKGNLLFDDHGSVSKWWSVETEREYDSTIKCLRQQLDAIEHDSDTPRTIMRSEAEFLDSAVLWPLYELYSHALEHQNETGLSLNLSGKVVNPKELFFYNYASAHCEDGDLQRQPRRLEPVLSPSKIRLNVALNNFPPFLETFSCGAARTPTVRCEVWKERVSATSAFQSFERNFSSNTPSEFVHTNAMRSWTPQDYNQ
ncbi:neprilysin-1-like [Dermacentor albipictus]|uniref:neprilysin-1-like n=1 Tax=Dermacentor albipictus TaxID=60249 RepID=UPI0031FDB050